MIAIETDEPLPVGEWTHITLTYDGSSRAAGLQALLERQARATRASCTTTSRAAILPFTSGDVFDPFLGLAFGTRFREKAPVGSGIDELRVFERDLTPARGRVPARRGARCAAPSSAAGARDAAGGDGRASRRRRAAALTAARAKENELATGSPASARHGRRARADADVRAEPRRLQRPRRARRAARPRRACSRGTRRWPQNRLGLAQWLFDRRQSADGARVRESPLADAFRPRHRRDEPRTSARKARSRRTPSCSIGSRCEFVESGWDIKALHRLIVTSATYRQSSVAVGRAARARRRQRALRARPALANDGRDGARSARCAASGLLVAASRRAERQAVSTGRHLESAEQLLRRTRRPTACRPTSCIGARCTRS